MRAFTRCARAFVLGALEAGGSVGRTYGNPYTLQSRAYDYGRTFGERLGRRP